MKNKTIKQNNVKIKITFVLVILFIVFLTTSQNTIAAGSIKTTTMNSTQVDMCGSYQSAVNITAEGISNKENVTLENVTATLKITPDKPGISITSNMTLNLGNITNKSNSLVNPQWTIKCDLNQTLNYTAYVEYSSSNGYFGTSIDEAITLITSHPTPDTTPPIILNSTESKTINQKYTQLTITTNENAVCRYSNSQDIDYNLMSDAFQITGGTNHVTQLNNLNDGVHRFYIKCSDPSGNTRSDHLIQIIVDQLPSAKIVLSSSVPLKAGIIEVKVIPSEDLQSAPILEYSYNFTSKIRIPVSEFEDVWLGELFVSESDNNKIGEFYFSGLDLAGNQGTKITSGNTFRVDTQPPFMIELFTAKSEDSGRVNLKWLSLDSDVNYYKIYRSEQPDVTNLDVLTKTSNNMFTDRTTEIGRRYYYKVSAVDDAGNEGELSDEVEILTGNAGELESTLLNDKSGAYLEVINTSNNRKKLVEEADTILNSFDNLIEQINNLRSDLKEDEIKSKLLYLDDALRNDKTEILNLQKQLKSLKSTPESVDITDNITSIKNSFEELKSEIPISVDLEDAKTVENKLLDQDIHLLLKDVLTAKKITKDESEINNYENFLKKANTKFNVNIQFVVATIKYLDETEKKATIIIKEISATEKDKNARYSAIEYVPTGVIKNSEELYVENKIKILTQNSLLETSIDTDKYQYYYIIKSEIKSETMSEIKTLILSDITKFSIGKLNTGLITGLSISNITNKTEGSNTLIYFIVLAIIAIFLFVKFNNTKNKDKNKNNQSKKGLIDYFNLSIDFILDLILGPKKDKKTQIIQTNNEGILTTQHQSSHQNQHQNQYPHQYQRGRIKEDADSYKPFISENLYVAGFLETENSDTKLLMTETEIAVNNIDLDSAIKLYKKAHTRYKPEDADKDTYNFMKRLHAKISILIKLKQINSMTNNDNIMLKHLLSNLEKQYSDIIKDSKSEEIPLLRHVYETYHKYKQYEKQNDMQTSIKNNVELQDKI